MRNIILDVERRFIVMIEDDVCVYNDDDIARGEWG